MIKANERSIPRSLRVTVVVFLLAMLCQVKYLKAQDAYTGTDFWTGFMSNNGSAGTIELYLSAATATTATVTIPNASPVWSTTVTIAANTITTVTIPASTGGVTMGNCASDVVTKTGIHITSTNPVSVYGSSSGIVGSAGAYIAIPTAGLGTNYLTMSPDGTAQFMAIATQNNTKVTIKLPVGKPAGSHGLGASWVVTLNAGETYRLETTQTGLIGDLTGTELTSDKPIAVLSGSACASFPGDGNKGGYANCGPCDLTMEFLPPVSAFGKKYVSIDFKNPSNVTQSQAKSSYLRIVTTDPGTTTFTITGYPQQTLTGRGNYMDYMITGGTTVISDKNIAVYAITSGNVCYWPLPTGGQGDASVVTLVPEEQWGKSSPFVCLNSFTSAINVLAKSANPNIVIDGTTYNGFTPIGTSGFFCKTIAMAAGTHLATSTSDNFMIYIYGFSLAIAYSYSAAGPTLKPLDKTLKAGYKADTVCVGSNTAFTDTSQVLGTQIATWDWTFGDGTPNSSVQNPTHTYATAGNYTVKLVITDTSGTKDSTAHVVVVKALPAITFGTVSPVCAGDSVQLSASGGDTYLWTPATGLSKTNISNPKAAPKNTTTYTVKVTNSTSGCVKDSIIAVTINPQPVANITGDLTVCPGGLATTLTATGGSSYKWLPGAEITPTISVLPSIQTDYSVIVTDAKGCKDTATATVKMVSGPASASLTIAPRGCVNIDGKITVSSVTGGTSPYDYSSNGVTFQSSNIFSGLDAQPYTITIRDKKGCSVDTTVTIGVTPAASMLFFTTVPSGCGTPIGSIKITSVNGGKPPYQYSLDDITYQTSGTFSSLGSGSYQIFVKDANGCVYDTTATVGSTSGPTGVNQTTTADSCGKQNGVIKVTGVVGGTSPYKYSIDGGAYGSVSTFSPLAGGNHTIGIQDAAGCQYSLSLNVPTLSPVTGFTAVATMESCDLKNGKLSAINVKGGTSPYQYAVNTGSYSTLNTFSNLDSGLYSITVQDKNRCSYTQSDYVGYLPPIDSVSDVLTAATCTKPNGVVNLTVHGGSAPYTFSLDGATAVTTSSFFNLSIGAHSVVVKDTNSCSITKTFTIVDTPGPTALAATMTQTSCVAPTGTITITSATGGTAPYTYSVNGSPYTTTALYSGLAAGTYPASVKDANGCQFDTTFKVTMVPGPTALQMTLTHTTCTYANGAIHITGTSGGLPPYDYAVDASAYSPQTLYPGLAKGSHLVKVKDANSCTYDTMVVLTDSPGPTDIKVDPYPTSCGLSKGKATVLSVTGGTPGYTYSFGNGPFTPALVYPNLAEGSYTLIARDANQCVDTVTIGIANIAGPFNLTVTHSDDTCGRNTGSITITNVNGAGAPFDFSIGGAFTTSQSFTQVAPGTYAVTARDTNGCTVIDTAIVGVVSGPTSVPVTVKDAHCNQSDGSLFVSKSGIIGGSGPYKITVGAVSNPPSSTFKGLAPGPYTLIVTDKNNCILNKPITIGNIAGPQSAGTITAGTTCGQANGSVTIDAVNGGTKPYTYSSDNVTFGNSNVFSGLLAGTYTYYVKDSAGCVISTTATPTDQPGPSGILVDVADENCFRRDGALNNFRSIGGKAPFRFEVKNQSFGTGDSLKKLSAGTFPTKVIDANGCKADSDLVVVNIPGPDAAFSSYPKTGEAPLTVVFHNETTDATAYSWAFGTGDTSTTTSPAYTYDYHGRFKVWLVATNKAGCTDSVMDIIEVKPPVNFFIPNTFSPNGDGVNDLFIVESYNVTDFTVRVYDRWGECLKVMTPADNAWDGNYKGSKCQEDVYVVEVRVVDILNGVKQYSAKLLLFR